MNGLQSGQFLPGRRYNFVDRDRGLRGMFFLDSASMSACCPPTILPTLSRCRQFPAAVYRPSGSSIRVARTSKAWVNSPSPARIGWWFRRIDDDSGAPPPQIVVIHRGEIVVDQGIRVNHFDRQGRGKSSTGRATASPAGQQRQQGTKSLPPASKL
ncbi:MAG: hypothetical protein R3C12_10410 [Planctomycetaceae bacterium]